MTEYCSECGRPILPHSNGSRLLTGPFKSRLELREAVMKLLEERVSGEEIAKMFGVSMSTISRIKHGDRTQTVNGYHVSARQRNGKN